MKKFVTWYLDNSRLVFFLWICLAILVLIVTKSMFCATIALILCILVFMLFDYLEDSSFLKEENSPSSKIPLGT